MTRWSTGRGERPPPDGDSGPRRPPVRRRPTPSGRPRSSSPRPPSRRSCSSPSGRCPGARSRPSPASTGRPSTRGSATSRCRSGRAAIRLLVDGDRVELATAPEAGALVARYVGADAVRLSPASLETLAIVAYRQPVTKAAVERIRGVDSDYTIRTLLHRRLVVELGRSTAPGRPFLYGTGFEFLERFGLTSLDELPPLDADVAARLAEEGGEPLSEPLFGLEPGPGETAGVEAAG